MSVLNDDPFPDEDTPTEIVLRTAMRQRKGPHFAVLDGALFDGLPGLMHHAGLRGRGLFIGAEHREIVAAGPVIIALDPHEMAERLVVMLGMARPPMVWSWPEGEQSLFDHLRRHTHVEVPDDDLWPSPDPHYVQVLFRHWDADVLALNWQVMTPYQQSRMVPPGHAVTLLSHHYGGLQQLDGGALRVGATLPKAHRCLRFEQGQMDRMDDLIAASYHPEVLVDLKALFPPGEPLPPEPLLRRAVEDGDWQAGQWGITSHDGVVMLSFWMLAFGRNKPEFAALRDAIEGGDGRGSADDRLAAFMQRFGETGEV